MAKTFISGGSSLLIGSNVILVTASCGCVSNVLVRELKLASREGQSAGASEPRAGRAKHYADKNSFKVLNKLKCKQELR